MATSLTLQNDASSPQGYVKVNGTTSATFTTSGITGNLVGNVTGNVTGSLTQGGSLTLATAQTASGTSVDFTGIPSWAKRITVMFNGVSTSGSSNWLVRVGYSGGISTSGYLGASSYAGGANSAQGANSTAGFIINIGSAAQTMHGSMTLTLVDSATNKWVEQGTFGDSSQAYVFFSGGSTSLLGTLDRIRITTVNSTDTFDAGTINIMFEG